MSLLFVDTNIPIYAAGKPHPLKAPCSEVLEIIAERPRAFVTDAEVLQELVHRYLSEAWSLFDLPRRGAIPGILALWAARSGR